MRIVSLTCIKHEIPEFHCSIKSFVKIFCLLLALAGYLIFRRQQIKKEQQAQEVGESENLNEDVEAANYPKQEQLQQVETGSVASAAAGDERVVEETDNKE